jgi:NADH-quinone oxidoreductase subunit A
MPTGYFPILILLALAIVLVLILLVASTYLPTLVGHRKVIPAKYVPYESGIRPIGTARRRVPIRFYLVAMVFLIFDVEVVFFYPWAVTFGALRNAGMNQYLGFMLAEVVLFIAVLLVGYVYLIKRGALDWE